MIQGHGGNIYDVATTIGCKPFQIMDMSSNVNPLGPPSGLKEHLKKNINLITALPEVDAKEISTAFANRYGLDPGCVLAGNGTTPLIYAIPQVLKTKKALILGPTYSDYADACFMNKVEFDYNFAEESHQFRIDINSFKKKIGSFDTVFICNPNNPTGTLISAQEINRICLSFPNIRFIIDEAYLSFANKGDRESMMDSNLPNIIILNSMSKLFRIPGLRVGFLIASKNIIESFKKYMLPWSVNGLAQEAVSYLMTRKAEIDHFIKKTREFIKVEKQNMVKNFEDSDGIKIFPSTTVFMLAKLPDSLTSDKVWEHLLQNRILVRNCSNFHGLSEKFIRISLKKKEINTMVADKISGLISDSRKERWNHTAY